MLQVFFGNDVIAVRKNALKAVTEAGPDVQVVRIDADTYTPGVLTDIAGATSLFGATSLYLLDTPSLQKDFFADVLENLSILQESPNSFILIEESLLAPEKKQFTKYAVVIEEYKKATTERFNAFTMADSLAKKDKRMLWVQLQEANAAGLSAEEIIGTLWWQLKSMRLAKLTKSATEAQMKDFPYNKAKRALTNFKAGEVEELSSSLLALYHQGHGGQVDIDLALEKWVLTV